MTRRVVGAAVAATVSILLVLTGAAVPAHADQARLRDAVKRLPVASETNAGYDRGKFRHWIDANGDCQDTRAEVLTQESSKGTTGGCTIRTGKWFSYYDRKTWTRASDVDIDHLVALKEAWGSGAKRWNDDTRKRYANDLVDNRSLVAVTDNVNQSKSDRDPAEWLPQYGRCRYVAEWTAVKLRWKLKVNTAEKQRLTGVARGCDNVIVRWHPARIGLGSGGGGTGGGGGTVATSGVKIGRVFYNPSGDERYTPNREIVVLRNTTNSPKVITGWTLRDTANHVYRLPNTRLNAGGSVTIHSGNGRNGGGHLYAGWGAVWNNDGDTAILRNAKGHRVHRCSWGGGGTVKYC